MRSLLLALLFTPLVAQGRVILQNDSLDAEGGEVVFYPRMQGEESFGVVLEVPEDHIPYRICRLLLLIGPRDFQVFEIRIHEQNEDETVGDIVWISDLDAFQVFGSRNQISSIDLRDYDNFGRPGRPADARELGIISDVRRLRVNMIHAPGFDGPPTIAADTDGISGPNRNWMWFYTRGGAWVHTATEEQAEDDPLYPRPTGDWVLRVDIVRPDEACPGAEDPLPDFPDVGEPPPPVDMGVELDEGLKPDRIAPDLSFPDPDVFVSQPDEGLEIPDVPVSEPDGATVEPDMESRADLGGPQFTRALKVDRIHPTSGPPDRNQDVVITGEGFPVGGRPEVKLGDVRLLEVEVTATSTLLAIVPAGLDNGVHDLSVHTDDGQTAVLPAAYTVGTDLALDAVEPAELLEGETGTLTFLGSGFTESAEFFVGGARVADLALLSGQRAVGALETTLAAGTYDVEVTRGEASAVLPDGFTVRPRGSGSAVDAGCGCSTGRDGAGPWLALLALAFVRRRG